MLGIRRKAGNARRAIHEVPREEFMARSKSKQKRKRHQHKLSHKRRLKRAKLARQQGQG